MEQQRFKTWTDGATGQVVMGIEKIKQEDEGAYKCVLNDEIEHEFSVYVTGMLFLHQRCRRITQYKHCELILFENNINFSF